MAHTSRQVQQTRRNASHGDDRNNTITEYSSECQPARGRRPSGDSPEEAVRESSIVTTITGSREPVLFRKWLQEGTHINPAGGNMVLRREADSETIVRSDRIVVDSTEQARTELSGEGRLGQQHPRYESADNR